MYNNTLQDKKSNSRRGILFEQIIIFVMFTFPFVTLFKFGRFTIQIETILFLTIFLGLFVDMISSKVYLDISMLNKKIILLSIFFISFLSIISLIYTQEVLSSQLKDLFYWILSMSPLIFTNKRKSNLQNYINTILVSSIFGVAILLFLRTGIRGSGFISSANLAGSLFVLAGSISLGVYLEHKQTKVLLCILINIIGIIATGSRESLITFFITIIIFSLFQVRKSPKVFIKWSTLVVLIIAIGIYALNNIFPEVLNRYRVTINYILTGDINNLDFAFANRISIWQDILEWVLKNPFKPLGFQGLRTLGIFGHYAHNMFLQSLVIGGVVGFILFIGILFSILIECRIILRCNKSYITIAVFSLLIGYIFTGLVSDHFLNFYTWNYVYFVLLRELRKDNKKVSSKGGN